jgi:hypothetical protein
MTSGDGITPDFLDLLPSKSPKDYREDKYILTSLSLSLERRLR